MSKGWQVRLAKWCRWVAHQQNREDTEEKSRADVPFLTTVIQAVTGGARGERGDLMVKEKKRFNLLDVEKNAYFIPGALGENE